MVVVCSVVITGFGDSVVVLETNVVVMCSEVVVDCSVTVVVIGCWLDVVVEERVEERIVVVSCAVVLGSSPISGVVSGCLMSGLIETVVVIAKNCLLKEKNSKILAFCIRLSI